MDLNRLAVRARLRSPWESIDLGLLLARRHWWPMFLVWLLPAALVFLLAWLLLGDSPGWGYLLLWWCKPLYDRLPLYIASRALFAEQVSARTAFAQFFAVNRRDWLAWLSWRRLSFTRSFDMPVTLLEQSSGAARASRLAVLHRKNAGAASWLTLTLVHVEMILALAAVALIYLLIPEQIEIEWLPFFSSGEIWLQWLLNGLSLLVMAAVAPFYVAGGFMLYIGRRVELEAWDIEIQFRNLRERLSYSRSQRQSREAVPAAAQLLLLCAVALGAHGLAAPASAQAENVDPVETPMQARALIDETLAGDDFHRTETVTGWRLKKADQLKGEDEAFPEWIIRLLEWLEGLSLDDDSETDSADSSWGPLLAGILELLLWTGAAALVLYLLWRYREQIGRGLRPRGKKPQPEIAAPETLFGLDVRQSSLPTDVCAEVLRLWQAGEERASLGLLYRATLAHLIERYQFAFADHLTEQECARLVQLRQRHALERQQIPVQPALVQLVQRLTAVWQQLAYAHRAPRSAQVEDLCSDWRGVFADEP